VPQINRNCLVEKLKKEQTKLKDDQKEELRLLRKKKDEIIQTRKDISATKDNVQKLKVRTLITKIHELPVRLLIYRNCLHSPEKY